MKDHFLETIRRLVEMKRFTIRQVNRIETTAEHSWFTAVLGAYIANKSVKHKYDILTVVTRCLFHDVPESIVSDIPYFIKHHNNDAEAFFKSIEHKVFDDVLTYGMDDDLKIWAEDVIVKCKDGTIEGKLVAICDLLEALWYLTEERQRGNDYVWVDEVVDQLYTMICDMNKVLKEPLINDITKYLIGQFGPIQMYNWSDILGGGYDKGIPKKVNTKGGKRNADKKTTKEKVRRGRRTKAKINRRKTRS